MITQSISKHRESNWFNRPQQTSGHVPHYNLVKKDNQLGKYEFAMYLQKLEVKKGDIVCYRNTQNNGALWEAQCHQVMEVIENHHLITSWDEYSGPNCLLLAGIDGLRPWRTGGNLQLVVPDDRLPEAWRKWKEKRDADAIDC